METKKYLFVVDLDGTMLKNSATGEICSANILAVRRAISEGHKVCIATGRPWRSAKKAYETLELDSVIANYNGAHVHNPSDYNFNPLTSYMNLNDVMYILGDKKLKDATSNIAIEGPGWVMVQKRDADLERVFGFAEAHRFRVGIDYHKLPLRPTGIIMDTKPGTNIAKLRDYLQRTYGDLGEFSSWSKGEGLTPVFDMTSVGINKGKVLPLLSRYYDIPMNRTIAIGDGYNDVPMFEVAEFSVAMANASDDIKAGVTYSTEKNNKESGVAEFINKFLDDLLTEEQSFIKSLKAKRKQMKHLEEKIVKAH